VYASRRRDSRLGAPQQQIRGYQRGYERKNTAKLLHDFLPL
jgi:hypothetical protein